MAGHEVVDGNDVMAVVQQSLAQVRGDEAGAAGHKDSHGVGVYHACDKRRALPPIRPTAAHIDLAALTRNFRVVEARVGPNVGLLAAVKGDAYGHGAVPCARALAAVGCTAFGVALVEEGALLRDASITGTILCLGGVGRYGAEEAIRQDLTPVVYDEGDAARLDAAAAAAGRCHPVHLKVDTGMGRLGVPISQWEHFLDRFARFRHLDVEGVLTHFAESESADATFTMEQARRFREAVGVARSRGFNPRILHAANSGGIFTHPTTHLDMVRPGIALYGVSPVAGVALEPVMRVATQVLFVKDLPRGASVSYGRRFVTSRPTRIATLPVGYADGYPRALSGHAQVIVGEKRCDVVGTICMDLCMVDVTEVPSTVESGEEAVLLGAQGAARIDVNELAAWAGTIPYEILTGFSQRVPRMHA